MAFPAIHPELTTERLILRAHHDGDIDALYALFTDPATMRYWGAPPWTEPAQAAAMLARGAAAFAAHEAIRFAVVPREGGAMIGSCTLFGHDTQNRRAEMGYILAREAWGSGLMTEALTAVLDWGFGALELHRVEADVDPRNLPSVAILDRLGFVREGFLRQRWHVAGEVSDSIFLGLLAPEWASARASLKAWGAVPQANLDAPTFPQSLPPGAPKWAVKKDKALRTRGAFLDPAELGLPAQWPETFQDIHLHGLELISRSGRLRPALFHDPSSADPAFSMRMVLPRGANEAWADYIIGRLLVGVGAEMMLKALFTKRGFSLRRPDDPRKQMLARLGVDDGTLTPWESVSFGVLLKEHNLKLPGQSHVYGRLWAAKKWRDQTAHNAMTWTTDSGWDYAAIATSIRALHVDLMTGADSHHEAKVAKFLAP